MKDIAHGQDNAGRSATRNGFVDLQVNGWMGISFTADGLTLDGVRRVTREQLKRGTIAYCPTVTTWKTESYRNNCAVLAQAMADPEIGPHLLGIHMEGPFISPLPGASGAHGDRYVRTPDCDDFDRFQEWARGAIRILTVAPEVDGMEKLIRHAVAQGVVVALGHHLSDNSSLQRAVDAGARCCTHLGNGIPNLIDRHNNPLWRQLACDKLAGLFITDGHHLPAPLIKVMLRAKTAQRFIVTSDASSLAGMPPGRYRTHRGRDVVITPAGRIDSPQTQSLSGSSSSMLECMNHLASLELLNEEELWTVGRDNPLRLLGYDSARINNLPGPDVRFTGRIFSVT